MQKIYKGEVKKPTALVHFKRDVSVTEEKLITLLIFLVQMKAEDKKDSGLIYVRPKFIMDTIGWKNSKNYQGIYNGILSLYEQSIEWNMFGIDRTFRKRGRRFLIEYDLPDDRGTGEEKRDVSIGFRLHPEIEKVARDPKVYAKIKMIMLARLSRPKHAYSIYELCIDATSRGEYEFKISLEEMKEYLGLSVNSYKSFKDFRSRVLNPSIMAIKNLSDLEVKFSSYRKGRKIGGVVFHMRKQTVQQIQLPENVKDLKDVFDVAKKEILLDDNEVKLPVEQRMKVHDYGISDSVLAKSIEKFGEEGVKEIIKNKLDELSRRKDGNNPIMDFSAYLTTCLNRGYGVKTEKEREIKELDAHNENIMSEIMNEEKQIEEFKQEFNKQKDEKIDHYMKGLNEEQMEIKKKECKNHMSDLQLILLKNKGWDSLLCRLELRRFIENQILSEEEKEFISWVKFNKGVELEESFHPRRKSGYRIKQDCPS